MAKKIKVLIVATGGLEYSTDLISKQLHAENIESITLEQVLLSGKPLNLKQIVDSVHKVVFLGDSQLIHETITSALVNYCISVGKVVPVSYSEKPEIRFYAEFQEIGYLTFESNLDSTFWEKLIQRINQPGGKHG